jgi:hypothetical protein
MGVPLRVRLSAHTTAGLRRRLVSAAILNAILHFFHFFFILQHATNHLPNQLTRS